MTDMDLSSSDGIVLLSRGGAGLARMTSLEHLADVLRERHPAAAVRVAFVDKATPSLPEALDHFLGLKRVAVIPLLGPDEPALVRWLYKVTMRWCAGRDTEPPRIHFAPPLMAAEGLADLVCHQIKTALASDEVAKSMDERWDRDPSAWSHVPEHRTHFLVCTGPRCTARGAVAVWESAGRHLQTLPRADRQIQLLQTSCQFPCNQGPLAIHYPQGVWFGHLDAQSVREVLRAHVLDGRPYAKHVVHWLGAAPCKSSHPPPALLKETPCTSNLAS